MVATTIYTLFMIMLFSFIGFGFVVYYAMKKINELTKPRTPLRADKKKMDMFSKLVKGFSFEERLFCIRILLGNYTSYIKVEGDKVVIQAIGKIPVEETPEDITG